MRSVLSLGKIKDRFRSRQVSLTTPSAQTLYQYDGFAMTLLTLDQAVDEDDEDIGIEDTFERYNSWNS